MSDESGYTSYRLMESWWRQACDWPKSKIADFFIGICEYAFDGKVPTDKTSKKYLGYWECRNSVSTTRARKEAGAKGAAVTNSANRTANDAANRTANDAAEKRENRESRENNGEVRVPRVDARTHEGPTLNQVKEWAASRFCPVPGDDFLAEFHRRMVERGWIDERNRDISAKGWTRALSAWWAKEREKKSAARAVAEAVAPRGADGAPLDSAGPELV